MAKEFENEFYQEIESKVEDGVLDKRTDLEKRRDEIKKNIEELEADVIKDPRTLENLKKELASVEKEINKEAAERALETGEVTGKDATEKDTDEEVKKEEEKEEEVKDEKSLNEEEKDKENEEKLKQAYHDSMVALHNRRMQTAKDMIEAGELVSSDEVYEQELELEAAMYNARDAYLDLGKEDPFREKRTEFIKLEKEAKEQIEMNLRNRAKRFKEIEEEIKNIDKREREINEELLGENINSTQIESLNKELKELGARRSKLEKELAEIKDKLDQAINTRQERLAQRAGLEQKHVETLTYKDKKNYDYQNMKVVTMNRNFDEATKMHYDNIKRRIEERERKIKQINKELKEVPDTDFEKRLLLLNELDKETNMLLADKEAKSDLDRGIMPTKEDMQKDIKEKDEKEEDRQEEMDKATEEVREVIERQDEKIGEAVVENPEVANVEEKERDTTMQAAAVAMVYDSPDGKKDGMLENTAQFVVAKECVIPELSDKVKNIDETEEGRNNAKEYLEQDKQIKEADKELDKVQENIEDKVQ